MAQESPVASPLSPDFWSSYGCCGASIPAKTMLILRFIRGLLPILFATVVLALSSPQVSATGTSTSADFATIDLRHDHNEDCAKEPPHAIGCCSAALALPATAFVQPVRYAPASIHGIERGWQTPPAPLQDKLFRPPRTG